MDHVKKITKVIVNIFTFILLMILLLVIYSKIVITFSKNSYPNYFGYTFFEVASGSMMPTLQVNDVILVKITKDNIKENDIIAFSSENSIITHRVLFIDNNNIVVKGDNNNTVDKPIVLDQVIGKVVKVFPHLGVWKKVLMDPKILIGLFVTLLLFDFALSYNNKDKKVKIIEKEKESDIKVKENNEKLLELTRKIDIEEINKLLDSDLKLNDNEINNVKEEIKKIDNEESNELDLSKKEQDFINYTIRLDLNEIKNKIDKNVM